MINFRKLVRSFGHGFRGCAHVLSQEQNMRVHVLAATAVIAAGAYFRLGIAEWLAVIISIGLVLSLECMNTAVERLADRVSRADEPMIGQVKDAAAAAVLCGAIMAIVVAIAVFGPRLAEWFG